MTDTNATLLARIEAHCRALGISESTFGLRAVNDGKLVSRLRAGKTVTLKTFEAINVALDAPQSSEAAE